MGVSRLLLDTHAFVWAVTAPHRLGTAARASIQDPTSELYLSSASVWEMATKYGTGRFPEAAPLVSTFASVCERLRVATLPITAAHALRTGEFQWSHRDPFDRMLAVQAVLEDLVLVTSDAKFGTLAGLRTIW